MCVALFCLFHKSVEKWEGFLPVLNTYDPCLKTQVNLHNQGFTVASTIMRRIIVAFMQDMVGNKKETGKKRENYCAQCTHTSIPREQFAAIDLTWWEETWKQGVIFYGGRSY